MKLHEIVKELKVEPKTFTCVDCKRTVKFVRKEGSMYFTRWLDEGEVWQNIVVGFDCTGDYEGEVICDECYAKD